MDPSGGVDGRRVDGILSCHSEMSTGSHMVTKLWKDVWFPAGSWTGALLSWSLGVGGGTGVNQVILPINV